MRGGVSGVNAYFQLRNSTVVRLTCQFWPQGRLALCKGEGRVRVSSGVIDVLGNDPHLYPSPLEQVGEEQKSQRLRRTAIRLVLGKGLVWIAVQPMLARLRRRDHWMSTSVRMFAGVLIRRAVAAQRDSTRLARPEMHPVGTDLYAFFAFATMRLLDRLNRNRIQMRTPSGIHDRLV